MVSRGFRAVIVFATLSCLILWREMHVLTFMENMRLHANPLSRPYVKYFLRVDNGQKSSIIGHFPPKVDIEPSVGVEIALYSEIHQTPFLYTFIHVVFPTLVINYANQRYLDDQAILTTKNTVMNSLNTHIAKAVRG
jgi:hypothetical protein